MKKSEDRIDDVSWLISTVFSFPLFGIIILLRSFLFENGYTKSKISNSLMTVIAIILVFSSMYVIHRYYGKNHRYKEIVIFFGENPTKKDMYLGFFFFLICVSMIGIVAFTMFLFMKLTH